MIKACALNHPMTNLQECMDDVKRNLKKYIIHFECKIVKQIDNVVIFKISIWWSNTDLYVKHLSI